MINELIVKTLKPLDIPVRFGIRGSEKKNCIVFNYTSENYSSSTKGEELFKYDVMINIYADEGSLFSIKSKLQKLMSEVFVTKTVTSAFFDAEINKWILAIQYVIFLESEMI